MAILDNNASGPVAEIKQSSKICGKHTPGRSVTQYEQHVNDASFELAKDNPGLLGNREELFRQAREKVRESGYLFKKGYSRSKDVISENDQTPPLY